MRRTLIAAYARDDQPDQALRLCYELLGAADDAESWKDLMTIFPVLLKLGEGEMICEAVEWVRLQLRESGQDLWAFWELVPQHMIALHHCGRLEEAFHEGDQALAAIRAVKQTTSVMYLSETIEFNLGNIARALGDLKTAMHFDENVLKARIARLGDVDTGSNPWSRPGRPLPIGETTTTRSDLTAVADECHLQNSPNCIAS